MAGEDLEHGDETRQGERFLAYQWPYFGPISSMATKRGRVSDRVAVVVGPEAEVSVIVGLGKSATDRLARAKYARLHGGTPGVGGRSRAPGR